MDPKRLYQFVPVLYMICMFATLFDVCKWTATMASSDLFGISGALAFVLKGIEFLLIGYAAYGQLVAQDGFHSSIIKGVPSWNLITVALLSGLVSEVFEKIAQL